MASTIFTQTSLLTQIPIAAAAVARCLQSPIHVSPAQLKTLCDAFAPGHGLVISNLQETFESDNLRFSESVLAGSTSGMSIQTFYGNYAHQISSGGKPQVLEPIGLLEDWQVGLADQVFGSYIAAKPLLRRALEAEIQETRKLFEGVETSEEDLLDSAIKQIVLAELAELGSASNNKGDEDFSRPYRGDFSKMMNGKHPVALFLWDKLLNRYKNWQSAWRQHMLVLDASRYLSPVDGSLLRGSGRINTRNVEGQLYCLLRDNMQSNTAGVQLVGTESPASGLIASPVGSPAASEPPAPAPIVLPAWLEKIAEDLIQVQLEIWDSGPGEEINRREAETILAAYAHRDRPGFLEYIRRPIHSAGIYSWPKAGNVLAWMNVNLTRAKGLAGQPIVAGNPIAAAVEPPARTEDVELLASAEAAAILANLKFEDVR